MCCIIDFENLSIQRHYYWPGIEALKDVSWSAGLKEYLEDDYFVLIVVIPGADYGGG